jgi:hypothetical protein
MIRRAGLQDFDRIMEMMINFANSSPYKAHHFPQYNDKYVRNFLCHVIKTGIVLVGEIDNRIEGMLIGLISSDPWLPEVKTMREIAWWVEEEHRMTSIGYKLLKKYVEAGEKLTDAGLIDGFTLTLMDQSPDLGLEKRGWKPIERNFLYEGAN